MEEEAGTELITVTSRNHYNSLRRVERVVQTRNGCRGGEAGYKEGEGEMEELAGSEEGRAC